MVASEWSRASRWALHPTFPSNQQEGSRWSPPVILKCVHGNCRLPSNITNVTWLPCLALLQKELLTLHRLDNQGQAVHRKIGPHFEAVVSSCQKRVRRSVTLVSPERGGGSWKKQSGYCLCSLSPFHVFLSPNQTLHLTTSSSLNLSACPCCLAHFAT